MENVYEGKINESVYDSISEEKREDFANTPKENIYDNPSVFVVKADKKERNIERRYDARLIIFAIIATLQIVAIIVLIYLLNAHVKESKGGSDVIKVTVDKDTQEVGKITSGNEQTSSWIQQSPKVCFGAHSGRYGSLRINQEGVLLGIKLDYLSGFLRCVKDYPNYKSHFGCRGPTHSYYNQNMIGVVVTDGQNNIVFPKSARMTKGFYTLPGYNAMMNTLAFTDYDKPMYTPRGMELRIWYLEDLIDYTDDENDGTVCVKVSAKFD